MASGDSPSPGRRILVVEDDPKLLAVIKDILEGEGYQVLEASCGEQAVAFAAQVRPDLVLLDMVLPDIPGEVVGRAVRILQADNVPVVAMSALGDIKERAMLTNVDARLTKPFSLEVLLSTVRSCLAGLAP